MLNYIDFEKKIGIYVCTYNRKFITEISINNLNQFKGYANLHIIDDASSYDKKFFNFLESNNIEKRTKHIGIWKLRKYQIEQFIKSNYEFCYLTDSDTIHDPNFILVLYNLYCKYNPDIISLYHSSKCHKTIIEENNDIIIKNTVPGVSMFFDKKRGMSIHEHKQDPRIGWDWNINNVFQKRFLYPKLSYLEHLGLGGSNNKTNSWDDDRALNPTEFLIKKRKEILKKII